MFNRTLFHVMRVILQEHGARWSSQVRDLTKPQYAVLEALKLEPDLDQAQLGSISATTKATLTEMLSRMEARGLIMRETAKTDGRQKIVTLTPEGSAVLDKIRPVAAEINQGMIEVLSEEEQNTLLDLLGKIVGSMESDRLHLRR